MQSRHAMVMTFGGSALKRFRSSYEYMPEDIVMRSVVFVATVSCLMQVALAADAPQVRPHDMAVRHITGNALVSPDQPKIALHMDKSFTALPVLAFPIRHDT